MPTTVADLTFEPDDPESPPGKFDRAVAVLPNGYAVTVITGRVAFAFWKPGLFEAALHSPAAGGLIPETIRRGDAARIDAYLAWAESLPPGLDGPEIVARFAVLTAGDDRRLDELIARIKPQTKKPPPGGHTDRS